MDLLCSLQSTKRRAWYGIINDKIHKLASVSQMDEIHAARIIRTLFQEGIVYMPATKRFYVYSTPVGGGDWKTSSSSASSS